MEKQDPEPGPAGATSRTPRSRAARAGAKGEPDLKAQNARLTQERDDWKKRAEEAEGQLKDLNDSLAKALTEDDVKAAVEEAQGEAKKAADAAESAWKQREKSLVVENALIAAGCSDTVGAIAHLDMDGIDVAKDGTCPASMSPRSRSPTPTCSTRKPWSARGDARAARSRR